MALTTVGCESSKLSRVTGTVSVDGALVKTGAISFVPVDGKSQITGAEIRDGGKYPAATHCKLTGP